MALRILTGLRRLAAHARDTAGAAGSAVVRASLESPGARKLEIGHTREWFSPRSRSQIPAIGSIVVAETAASLDDLADPGPALVAAAARLLDELGTSFGIAEMGQLTPDGAIRRKCWIETPRLLAWAGRYGIGSPRTPSRAPRLSHRSAQTSYDGSAERPFCRNAQVAFLT